MKATFGIPLALIASAAFGQTGELQPVTVTATRVEASPFDVPAAVDVIDGDRARSAGRAEISLSESLGLVPGVAARDRQNYAQDMQLSIRGFGARSTFGVRGVRLYVDGIPATMPDGQGQLSHIDLASLDRIEVLRGPFSALYGNSSGGVVQIFTRPGEDAGTVTASVVAGSDGLLRPGLRVSGASPAFRYTVSANHLSTDGSRDHSSATRDLFNARLDFPAKSESSHWTLVANSVRLRADDPLGLTRAQFESAPQSADAAAAQFDTRKTVDQQQLGLIHEHKLDARDSLRLMLYAGTRDTQQFQAIPVATQTSALHPGGVIGLSRQYAGADARWTAHRPLNDGSLEIVGGVSIDGMNEHRLGWQNFSGVAPNQLLGVQGVLRRDEDNRVWNADPYLQAVWKPSPHWNFSAGIRHSQIRFTSRDQYIVGANGDDSGGVRYSATLPALAALYSMTPDLNLYAAAGKGFETPTFNELAYRPAGGTGLNFSLRPSRSTNLEVGVKGRSRSEAMRSEWNLALFQTGTQDELVTQTNSGGRSTFQNAGATTRRGIEASWTAQLTSGWRLQAAQTWLDARYRDAFLTCATTPCSSASLLIPRGNRIPGTAQSVTALEVAWQPARGWQGGAELRRSSSVFVNDANSDTAPSFTAISVNGGYVFALDRWTISTIARVDNLTNRKYAGSVIVNDGNGRFYEPAPGRTALVKLSGTYAF